MAYLLNANTLVNVLFSLAIGKKCESKKDLAARTLLRNQKPFTRNLHFLDWKKTFNKNNCLVTHSINIIKALERETQ